MSFSTDVKSELCCALPENECCIHAMAYGMALFGKKFTPTAISFFTELEAVSNVYRSYMQRETGINIEMTQTDAGNYKYTVEDRVAIGRIFDSFSMSTTERLRRISLGNLQNLHENDELYDCCDRAFLRGVFLACGTIAEPEKSYHMEFAAGTRQLSLDLIKLLHNNGFEAKTINRRGANIVYIKDSTVIEQLLCFIGTQNQVLKFIDVRLNKQMKNQLNRENNFDIANIARTATASATQIDAIRRIRESGTFEFLDDDLKLMAVLREENDDASLTQLGQMFTPPITRSAVNYKIKKLLAFSNKTKEEILSMTGE